MLPITRSLIERAAARLSDGGWRYTPRQLYYATCAEAETRRSNAAATGQIGFGVLLILVALILVRFAIPFTVLLALGLTCISLGIVQRGRRTPMRGRVLALSHAEFIELAADATLPDMLADAHAEPDGSADSSAWRCVVCDSRDAAMIVTANATAAQLKRTVVRTPDTLSDARQWRVVIALHDASPRGCALPLELADSGVSVIDAGLRPAWVDGPDQQTLQGAPARMPRDLSSLLTDGEISWLASGERIELATLPPQQILRLVSAAVDQAERDANVGNSATIRALQLSADQIAQIVAPHPRGGLGSAPARGVAAPGRGAFPSVQ